MTQVQGSSQIAQPAGMPGVHHTQAASTLLPAPEAGGDALASLYSLFSKDRQLGLKGSVTEMHQTRALKKRQLERAKTALREAAKAQRKGGFFKRLAKKCAGIAKYAAVAASIAVAVGTGGAGTPLAVLAISGAVMSTAAVAQSEFQVLQKLNVSDDWANGIGTGLMVGGAVCGLGAGVATLCDAGAQSAASALEVIGQKAATVASGIQGVSTAAAGYATWQQGEAHADAQQRFADVTKARSDEQRLERMLTQILTDIEDSEKEAQRTLGHLRGAMDARDATISLCSTKV